GGKAEARRNRRHQRKLARRQQQRARLPPGREGREGGRTFGHAGFSKYPELNPRRAGATLRESRWGLSPYNALAAELNFGNEGDPECGTITQARQRLAATRSPGT